MRLRHMPINEVHQGTKGSKTGGVFNTNDQSSHWENATSRMTCDKNGSEN